MSADYLSFLAQLEAAEAHRVKLAAEQTKHLTDYVEAVRSKNGLAADALRFKLQTNLDLHLDHIANGVRLEELAKRI